LEEDEIQQSTIYNEQVMKPQIHKKKKSGRDALPTWGRKIKDSLQMTMITHADQKHVHAISGAAWCIGGYALLFSSWIQELMFDDWSEFATLNPFVR
jgi:hypothetical protein